ncbi:MAG: glycosyltransferase family 39 protein [Chthonomonadetes bacterium]|nr:glycosyltransferase family 39 protein [Chthonomonadetes bacterium]
MSTRSRSPLLQTMLPVALPLVAIGMGCFFGIGAAGLFDLDEGLYATAARQMVESGDWLVPRVGTDAFFDKPPLTYWAQALSMKVFGFTPLAARLPSALAGALTAWLIWQWAKRRELERIGWLALLVYPLCPLTMGLARQAIMDSLLTLWLTLAIFGWIEGYTGDRRWYLLMAAGAGLATMTKGLIGLLLPGGALLLWTLLRRDWAEWKRIPWLPAIGVYLLIVLPWHLAVWQAAGDLFVREYIVRHHIQRFLGKEFGHVAPFWFYIPLLLVDMYPWSAFVPIIGWQALSGWRCEKEKLCCAWAMWAFWAVVVVLFFSLSRSKLPGYVLPAVPALCLLVAVRLHSLWTVKNGLRPGEAGLMGFTGLILSAAFALVGVLGWQWQGSQTATLAGKQIPADVVGAVAHMAPFALMLSALFLLSVLFLFARWSSTPRVVGTGVLFGLLFAFLVGHDGLPRWDSYDIAPLHRLAQSLAPELDRGAHVLVYAFEPSRPSVRFIMGHPAQVVEMGEPHQLQEAIQGKTRVYILAETRTEMPSDLPCNLVREREDGRWVIYRCEPSAR